LLKQKFVTTIIICKPTNGYSGNNKRSGHSHKVDGAADTVSNLPVTVSIYRHVW
jgi:hypothetical protein